MNSYIVMQGHSYREDRDLGIIWSFKIDKGGQTPHSWERMKEVKEGDRIFHYVKGDIVAMSIAKEGCIEAPKPGTGGKGTVGYLVKVEYHEFDVPVSIRQKFQEIAPFLPVKYSPFQENGDGNQGYLYPCNEELAIRLIELIGEKNFNQMINEQLEFSLEQIRISEDHLLVSVMGETESKLKAKIRVFDTKHVKDMTPLWDGTCAICGIRLPELLASSRAKPWKDCSNVERLDPFNGLLLCRNHQALFENGFISFDAKGRVKLSSALAENGISGLPASIPLYQENKSYLKWHRKHVFKDQ